MLAPPGRYVYGKACVVWAIGALVECRDRGEQEAARLAERPRISPTRVTGSTSLLCSLSLREGLESSYEVLGRTSPRRKDFS